MLPKKPPKQKQLVTVNEAGNMLGISTATLYRYEKQKLLVPLRTVGGHRRYSLKQLTQFKDGMKSDGFIRNKSKRFTTVGGDGRDV